VGTAKARRIKDFGFWDWLGIGVHPVIPNV
jgi:hypothetical protein